MKVFEIVYGLSLVLLYTVFGTKVFSQEKTLRVILRQHVQALDIIPDSVSLEKLAYQTSLYFYLDSLIQVKNIDCLMYEGASQDTVKIAGINKRILESHHYGRAAGCGKAPKRG